jgi:alcohol/geraniol dehydrogenase (NADP+)
MDSHMSNPVHALAAHSPKGKLEPYTYTPGDLAPDEIEIAVESCGICHSDLSMLNNDWNMTAYPFVPGHEVVGRVVAAGSHVPGLPDAPGTPVGRTVGLGWTSASCMTCYECLRGHHNVCPTAQATIVGRHGGFADRVRCHWSWAFPLPDGLDAAKAGPLFCGGITVFHPLLRFGVKPVDRVAVIGIGGLGSMAIQFLNRWGCDVTAFSSNPAKTDEILAMGAHSVVNSRDSKQMARLARHFQFIVSTVNVGLDWGAILSTLGPGGRLHFAGAVAEPIQLQAFPLIVAETSVGGSPTGTPETILQMLEFCARHSISPVTEMFPMSQVNEAFAHLEAGKARYRIVLQNDLSNR